MRRTAATIFLALSVLLLPAAPIAGIQAMELELAVRAVPLNHTEPTQTQIGRLTWRGGLEITSPYNRFGGLSGLLISPDGAHLTAIGDAGFWIVARIVHDANGFLTGLAESQISRLRGFDGKPLYGKTSQDAEAMTEMAWLNRQGRLDCPALCLLGSRENVVVPEAARAGAARIGARLEEITGARHDLLMEAPSVRDRVWVGIDRFLAENGL